MKAFAQFEVPGAVSAPFLKGLLTKLQLPVPSDEELEAFVTAVETERNTAKPSSDSEVKAVDIGNCTYRANAVAKGELLKYIDNAEHHGEKTKTMYVPSVSIIPFSGSLQNTHTLTPVQVGPVRQLSQAVPQQQALRNARFRWRRLHVG